MKNSNSETIESIPIFCQRSNNRIKTFTKKDTVISETTEI